MQKDLEFKGESLEESRVRECLERAEREEQRTEPQPTVKTVGQTQLCQQQTPLNPQF
jgi:hypothetical protein